MATTAPRLALRGITKTFGSVQALDNVDFEVRPGEVMALVGDNGAGKSTLIKCVAGIYPIDAGEIHFDGETVNIHGPKDAAKLGIEVVYQDLALCDNLDVVQNMFLGREVHDPSFRLKESPMEQRTAETLRSLSVTTIKSIRQPVASLSGGQRQSVAVARAVLWNSRLVELSRDLAGARGHLLAAEEDVGDDVEVVAEGEILVDGRDPEFGRVLRARDRDFFPFEAEAAGIRRVDPRDRLHQGRLAGAVVADQTDHLAGADGEVDPVQSLDRAESHAYCLQLEERSAVSGHLNRRFPLLCSRPRRDRCRVRRLRRTRL